MGERVRKRQRRIAKLAGCPSNRYHLIDNDDQFQLTMDVPGVKEEDIDIKLDDGQLTVQGHRTVGSESSRFSSKFFRSFSLFPPPKTCRSSKKMFEGSLLPLQKISRMGIAKTTLAHRKRTRK